MQEHINQAKTIVIIQADNPDGDSLATSLALEQILSELGKTVHMYCGVDIPTYLRYMEGWDRVTNDIPHHFDLSIIVDTSTITLLEQATDNGDIAWLKSKPCIVIDHHVSATPSIDFATLTHIVPAVSTGEIVYELCEEYGWSRTNIANDMITISIMSDSLGLTSHGTTARSVEIIAKLVGEGVSISKLDSARRALQKKSRQLVAYKADLLGRIEYAADNRIAYVHIPWSEIERYSSEYNPSVLVIDEMRQTIGVEIAIAFKTYPDGRITAKIRANHTSMIADKLASEFGGGGHPYAAGFRVVDHRSYDDLLPEVIAVATKLLDAVE
jgi:bifunctional oligoribonuclease and PAP phosphatase NrnA